MALTGQQARGRVQANPARAGQIHLAPGVQVGEIDLGAAGAVERLDVGRELNQVARHKARRQPQVAKQLYQQPGRVSARAAAQGECLFRRLHTGLHADQVADVLVQASIDIDQKVDRAQRRAVHCVQVFFKGGGEWQLGEIGLQFFLQRLAVVKRHFFGRGLDKEVKRVEHRHFGHQVHRDLEFGGFFGEHQAGLVVGKRVLLPVDEVVCWLNAQAVRQDAAAAMRRGAQANHLGAELHRTVVTVVGDVVQGNVDGHGGWVLSREKTGWKTKKRPALGRSKVKELSLLGTLRVLVKVKRPIFVYAKQETRHTQADGRPHSVRTSTLPQWL